MIKPFFTVAALVATTAATAQTPARSGTAPAPAACPADAPYATIRHSIVMPGKWAEFQQAVADHTAWYARHGDATTTTIARILAPRNGRAALSEAEAVTITRYSGKPQPARDAGYDAFTAKYRASATIKDEMRVCLPQ